MIVEAFTKIKNTKETLFRQMTIKKVIRTTLTEIKMKTLLKMILMKMTMIKIMKLILNNNKKNLRDSSDKKKHKFSRK